MAVSWRMMVKPLRVFQRYDKIVFACCNNAPFFAEDLWTPYIERIHIHGGFSMSILNSFRVSPMISKPEMIATQFITTKKNGLLIRSSLNDDGYCMLLFDICGSIINVKFPSHQIIRLLLRNPDFCCLNNFSWVDMLTFSCCF
jgi:hypothetical protein